MRRPYRTMRHRMSRRLVALGRRLEPTARHRLRRTADFIATLRRRPVDGTPEVIDRFDFWATIAAIADTATAALARAGVEVVRLDSDGRTALAVPVEARAEALAALAGDPAASGWWLAGPAGRPAPVSAVATGRRHRDAAALTLFRLLAAPNGTPVAGPECGVSLQFWTLAEPGTERPDGGTHTAGTRLAPIRNPLAAYLTPGVWQDAQRDPARRLRAEAPVHLLRVAEPIDIVYTWVDDSDPEWRRRRASVQPPGTLSADALHGGRTEDRDELRYSLRSVSAYAGWYRQIWLVTDGQVPAWLVDHPRLTVVTHREIFTDPSLLPTFNSHAIESQLHHIDGLAEHFLYFNDDVFIGRPVRPELFFTGTGLAKFTLAPVAIDRQDEPGRLSGAMHAARNNRALLADDLGRSVTNRIQHIPHAHLRSSLADFEARHPDRVSRVAAARFRSPDDLSLASELGHYWAYARRQAVTTTLAFRYVDIGSPFAAEHLDSLLTRRNQDCFCVNDAGPYPHPVDGTRVTDFLSAYFPLASPFERTTA